MISPTTMMPSIPPVSVSPTPSMASTAGESKKPRITKQLPLEIMNYDMSKFLKAPYILRLLEGDSILNVTPVNIQNITQELYSSLVSPAMESMHNVSSSETDTLVNGQIGFTIHFTGTRDDQHILYGFDSSWLSDETSSFKSWFDLHYSNDSMCVISNNVRGWGKEKIKKTLDKINSVQGSLSTVDVTNLEISKNAASFIPKTSVKQNLKSTVVPVAINSDITALIKTITDQQLAFKKQMADQMKLISLLIEHTQLKSQKPKQATSSPKSAE